MHATASDIAASDFAAQFTAELQQAQRDALSTIHKVMLHLAQRLTKPQDEEDEDPTQARTTTQRIRLCLQAAREILRLRRTDEPTTQPRPRPTATDKPSTTQRTNRPHPAAPILAAAGRTASRFGERIAPPRDSSLIAHTSASPHDSGPSTHDSSADSSAFTRDSSLVAQTPCGAKHSAAEPEVNSFGLQDRHPHPSSPPSSVPSLVKTRPPRYFTSAETEEILAVMRKKDERLPPRLYAMILEWNAYADTLCFGIKQHELEARKPLATGDDGQSALATPA